MSISYIKAPNDHLLATKTNVSPLPVDFYLTNRQPFRDHFELIFRAPCTRSSHKTCSSVHLHESILYIDRNQSTSRVLKNQCSRIFRSLLDQLPFASRRIFSGFKSIENENEIVEKRIFLERLTSETKKKWTRFRWNWQTSLPIDNAFAM